MSKSFIVISESLTDVTDSVLIYFPESWASKGSAALSDATVPHGRSFANSFPSDLERSPFVIGHALVISAQIRLHLLPHFPLGVQIFIRLTWIRQQRDKQVSWWSMKYGGGDESKSWVLSNDLEHARKGIFSLLSELRETMNVQERSQNKDCFLSF